MESLRKRQIQKRKQGSSMAFFKKGKLHYGKRVNKNAHQDNGKVKRGVIIVHVHTVNTVRHIRLLAYTDEESHNKRDNEDTYKRTYSGPHMRGEIFFEIHHFFTSSPLVSWMNASSKSRDISSITAGDRSASLSRISAPSP